MHIAIPANHKVKNQKNKKWDKYLELKMLWNMKVAVILIIISAFGTIPKDLVRGLEELEIRVWSETFQATVLLRLARILRRV